MPRPRVSLSASLLQTEPKAARVSLSASLLQTEPKAASLPFQSSARVSHQLSQSELRLFHSM